MGDKLVQSWLPRKSTATTSPWKLLRPSFRRRRTSRSVTSRNLTIWEKAAIKLLLYRIKITFWAQSTSLSGFPKSTRVVNLRVGMPHEKHRSHKAVEAKVSGSKWGSLTILTPSFCSRPLPHWKWREIGQLTKDRSRLRQVALNTARFSTNCQLCRTS